jgi:hypothetical protein
MNEKTHRILVFKTSLQTPVEHQYLSVALGDYPGIIEWSLDMDDWEKVLIIRSRNVSVSDITNLLNSMGIKSLLIAEDKQI